MGNESNKREDLHSSIVPAERIEGRILLIRGEKVILDVDLAALYGVTTKRLNQQVRRNLDRFPCDFLFRLTRKEVTNLRLHFATSNGVRGGLRYLPYAFTEHGAIIDAIKRLMAPPGRPDAPAPPDKRRIGFHAEDGGPGE